MQVAIREFCKQVTGNDHNTDTCRNLLKKWGIPLTTAGSGKGTRIYHTVDASYYEKALRTHLSSPTPTSKPGTVLSRLAVIEGKLDSIINQLSRGPK